MENLAREKKIGRGKREGYIFTRRGLMQFLEYLESKSFLDRSTGEKKGIKDAPKEIIFRAIQYYYLDKLTSEEDIKKAQDQLDTFQLSESTWLRAFDRLGT